MTFLIGAALIVAGLVAISLYPANRAGGPLMIAGAVVLVLRFTGAIG